MNSANFNFFVIFFIIQTTTVTLQQESNNQKATADCPSSSESRNTDTATSELKCAQARDANFCELFPDSGEGPFYIPNQKIRSNITEGKPGLPVHLTLIVRDISNCQPIVNVPVEIWHSDALGYYSGYLSYYKDGQLSGLTGGHEYPTDDDEFLRGVQYTDSNGQVTFQTIYPGWYSGRSNHYHIAVRNNGKMFPGHIYFSDQTTVDVGKVEPYTKNKNKKVLNADDWPYKHRGGTILKFNGTPSTEFHGVKVLGIQN